MEKYLNTNGAAEYLTDHGLITSPKTLAKLRCIGGGPVFQKFGNRIIYQPPHLLDYAESKLSAPMKNTSSQEAA